MLPTRAHIETNRNGLRSEYQECETTSLQTRRWISFQLRIVMNAYTGIDQYLREKCFNKIMRHAIAIAIAICVSAFSNRNNNKKVETGGDGVGEQSNGISQIENVNCLHENSNFA